jgi:ParB-like chromosome segregation protein Spo0J
MPTVEDRMTGLETRMDELAVRCGDAAAEAANARDAHRQNIVLLNALRVTQAEHGRTLAEHGKTLAEHGKTLGEHSKILNEHTKILNQHTAILGKLTVGVHDIQLSIKHLIDRYEDGS